MSGIDRFFRNRIRDEMTARAATAVRSEPRHRAQVCRFLGRKLLRRLSPAAVLRAQLLGLDLKAVLG